MDILNKIIMELVLSYDVICIEKVYYSNEWLLKYDCFELVWFLFLVKLLYKV